MLGILLLFFIGKYYYELAQDYYKHRWLYGALGIATYYAGTAIGGFVLGVANELFDLGVNWDNMFGLSLIALPFGVLLATIVYFLLKRNWKKTVVCDKDDIQDIGKKIEE
jgi:MFS family permease